jgi:hypothetical protein
MLVFMAVIVTGMILAIYMPLFKRSAVEVRGEEGRGGRSEGADPSSGDDADGDVLSKTQARRLADRMGIEYVDRDSR